MKNLKRLSEETKNAFHKTVGIFEELTHKEIQLELIDSYPRYEEFLHNRRYRNRLKNKTRLLNQESFIENERLGNYLICIFVYDENDSYTILEHHLSHILFESPIHNLPEITQELTQDSAKFQNFQRLSTLSVQAIFNLFEDQRMESLWGQIYRGSKHRFYEMNSKINVKFESVTNPIEALWASRYNKKQMLRNSKFSSAIDYIQSVELSDVNGTAICTKIFYDEFVTPWLDELEKKFPNQQGSSNQNQQGSSNQNQQGSSNQNQQGSSNQNQQGSSNQNQQGSSNQNQQGSSNQNQQGSSNQNQQGSSNQNQQGSSNQNQQGSSNQNQQGSSNQNQQGSSNQNQQGSSNQNQQNQFSEISDSLKKIEKELESLSNSDHSFFSKPSSSFNKKIFDDLDWELTKSKKDGYEAAQKIIEALVLQQKPVVLKPLTKDLIEQLPRNQESLFDESEQLRKKLQKLFRYIKERKLTGLDDSGIDVDLDAYIQSLVKKTNKFFLDEKTETGLDIVIGVDCSSSMKGKKIDTARDLCASLFKSLQHIDNVNLLVVGWGGPFQALKIGVTDITKFEEIKFLNVYSGYGLTPTPLAIQYCTQKISKMSGNKKLIIFITDGKPTSFRAYTTEQLVRLSKKAVDESKQKGITMIGIHIESYNDGSEFVMNTIFGGRYMHCKNIDEASKKVTRVFTQHVTETLISS